MAKQFDHINIKLQTFIEAQKMFFIGTADVDGRVNVSPKGLDSLKVLSPNRVIWLNLTGSGNETAAHILQKNRMTIMFCAFEGKPLILRLYGQAKIIHESDTIWEELIAHFPSYSGARQIFDVEIDLVQTSCGFAVPLYAFEGHRDQLNKWSAKKGEKGIKQYWQKKNTVSIDGKETDIEAKEKTSLAEKGKHLISPLLRNKTRE
ncbi:MAG: pyridoxamine 5'-phosphate oxidase family protein [Bacteroidota bacterium]